VGLLIVGSLAMDTVETPFNRVDDALGGSATYISLAASYFTAPVNLVGVVGEDFPKKYIDLLENHNIDLQGLQVVPGEKTFRWAGKYHYDMNSRETLLTELMCLVILILSSRINFAKTDLCVSEILTPHSN
jgi:sugar/nucleoside kinase (ribokinase family)